MSDWLGFYYALMKVVKVFLCTEMCPVYAYFFNQIYLPRNYKEEKVTWLITYIMKYKMKMPSNIKLFLMIRS